MEVVRTREQFAAWWSDGPVILEINGSRLEIWAYDTSFGWTCNEIDRDRVSLRLIRFRSSDLWSIDGHATVRFSASEGTRHTYLLGTSVNW